MIASTSCEHCGALIEFDAEQYQPGAVGDCHQCGKTSALTLPSADVARAEARRAAKPLILPDAPERPTLVEDSLETVGVLYLVLGVIAGVLLAVFGIYLNTERRSGELWIVAGVAVIAQSGVVKILFYAFAEVIRLLRARQK